MTNSTIVRHGGHTLGTVRRVTGRREWVAASVYSTRRPLFATRAAAHTWVRLVAPTPTNGESA